MASCQQNADWQSTKKTVLERGRYMFNNPFMSDIQFSCVGSSRKFHAHKYVLATSSSVFYRMFYGELAETKKSIELTDSNDDSLVEFLRFMYTDDCNLTRDNVAFVLYLTHKYYVPSLAEKCVEFFEANLTAENVFDVLQQAHHFNEKKLEKKCWDVIDLKTNEAVVSDAFVDVSQSTLVHFLGRESLSIEEVDLFKGVVRWSEAECSRQEIEANAENKRAVIGDAIYQIRFLSMTSLEFGQNVSQSGILTPAEVVLFYDRFSGGVERTSEVWNLSGRRARPGMLLRLCRFSDYGLKLIKGSDFVTWKNELCISFSKPVKLHGVRLLGKERKYYDVKLEVGFSQSIEKKFRGQKNSHDIAGFDVMFLQPIKLQANVIVHLKLTMAVLGTTSFGSVLKETTETNGITVNFLKLPESTSGPASVKDDFFDEIIFSKIQDVIQD